MGTSLRKSDFVTVNGVRLHYLDWGGEGPVLLFIPGMGCSAYIFDEFAPRFTDQFHVLALTRRGHGDSDYPETGYDIDTLTEDLRQFLDALGIDRVILAGHSMGYLELSRFAALYPERVIKLIYLDAAYNRQTPEDQAVYAKNPIPKLFPAWPEDGCATMEENVALTRRNYPGLNSIWGPLMDEEVTHAVKESPEGRIVDKMSEAIAVALNDTMHTYDPDYAHIQVPMLSIFAERDGTDFLSYDYMTEAQRTEVLDYFKNEMMPYHARYVEQFRHAVPQAQVVVIPHGHHYCFIKHEDLVYNAMRAFLLETTHP